jgi:hypothetical protein
MLSSCLASLLSVQEGLVETIWLHPARRHSLYGICRAAADDCQKPRRRRPRKVIVETLELEERSFLIRGG